MQSCTYDTEAPLSAKLAFLKDRISSLGSLAVAFSGGVDSTFLTAVAHDVLGDRAAALTCRSPFVPGWEFAEAEAFCRERNIPHYIIDADPLSDENVRSNPADRCYFCKKMIFEALTGFAQGSGLGRVADGANLDDLSDYRPGSRATAELGILSPLRDAGLTKADIRELSKEMGLPTWNKPAYACLASRIAYGDPITPEKLAMIESAEDFLTGLGFSALRVRTHGRIARIELPPEQIERAADPAIRSAVTGRLKDLGFTYVTLDLSGYRMGSMNQALD